MFNVSGRRWLVVSLFGILLLAVLALLLLVVFPSLVDLDSYKAYVLDQIESRMDGTVTVSDVSLSIFPGVRVDFEHVVLLSRDDLSPIFSADRLAFALDLPSLLQRNIVVEHLELDRPRLTLRSARQEHGRFSTFFRDWSDGGATKVTALIRAWSVKEVTVRDGRIGVTPGDRQDSVSAIGVERVNMRILASDPGGPLEFTMSGGLLHGDDGDHAEIRAQGTFSAQTVKHPSSEDSALLQYRLAGTTQISSLDLARLQPYLGTHDNEALYGLSDLEAEVTMALDPMIRRLSANNVTLQTKTGNLAGSIVLQQTDSEPWTFQGEISTSSFDIQKALTVFSPRLDETTFYNAATESELSGNARIVHAAVSGRLGDVSETAVAVELELERISGRFGVGRVPFRNVNASMFLHGDTMELRSLSGRYGGSDVLSGIGTVTDVYNRADIDATVEFMVPTSKFLDFLAARRAQRGRSGDLWGYASTAGNGRLTLKMTGSLQRKDIAFEGMMNSRGMGFHSTWMELPVAGLLGRLHFSPDGVWLTDVKGRVGRSHVQSNAYFARGDSTIEIKSHADARELMGLLLAKAGFAPLPSGTRVRGTTLMDLQVERRAEETAISATLDVTGTGYLGESGTSKPAGVAARINANMVLHDTQRGKRVQIQRMQFHLAPLLLTASGTVALTTPTQYSVLVATNLVRLEEFHERAPRVTIRGLQPEAGLFESRLTFTGVGGEWKAMGVDGEVSLLRGRMRVPGATKADMTIIEDVNAALKFSREDGGRVGIRTLSGTVKGTQIHTTGDITGLRALPRIRVSIDTPQFDFESLTLQDEPSPLRRFVTSLSRTAILQSDIHVGTSQYNGVAWHDVNLVATGMDGVVALEVRRARVSEGHLQTRMTVHMTEDEPMRIGGHAEVTGVPARDVAALLGWDERILSGMVDVSGELFGRVGRDADRSAALDGRVHLTLSDGRIRKFTALSRMLNLLNLPQLLSGHVPDLSSKGLAFDSMRAVLAIKQGAMTIEEFALSSPVMKIGGAGRYDIPTDDIDAVMAVSPLGSYESVLNKIPVLNKIIAGGDQRRGIVTALFEIKGPLDDPEVTVMPGESLTSGLTGLGELALDVLKNTLLLPKELIAPTGPGAP